MLLDTKLLDKITAEAKASPRLRMNFNLHDSLDAKAQRLFNALEPGTVLPVHRHTATAETYIVVRGRIDVLIYNDKHELVERQHLDPKTGNFGFQIPKNTWHTLDVLDSGTVIFEVKDGPYTPLTPENILS